MMSISDYIAILSIHGADYRCIISGINKSIKLMQNIDLAETNGTL